MTRRITSGSRPGTGAAHARPVSSEAKRGIRIGDRLVIQGVCLPRWPNCADWSGYCTVRLSSKSGPGKWPPNLSAPIFPKIASCPSTPGMPGSAFEDSRPALRSRDPRAHRQSRAYDHHPPESGEQGQHPTFAAPPRASNPSLPPLGFPEHRHGRWVHGSVRRPPQRESLPRVPIPRVDGEPYKRSGQESCRRSPKAGYHGAV